MAYLDYLQMHLDYFILTTDSQNKKTASPKGISGSFNLVFCYGYPTR